MSTDIPEADFAGCKIYETKFTWNCSTALQYKESVERGGICPRKHFCRLITELWVAIWSHTISSSLQGSASGRGGLSSIPAATQLRRVRASSEERERAGKSIYCDNLRSERCSDWHLLCMISTVFLLVDAFDRFFLVDALDLLRLCSVGFCSRFLPEVLSGSYMFTNFYSDSSFDGVRISPHVLLEAREQGSTPRRSAPSTQPVYKQFRELGPTEFKGTTDPIAAEGWIRFLETIFDFMQLTDVDKVRCAIFMLRDDARLWWKGARLTVDLATLTWTDFKEVFYGKYFTVDNRTRLAREFLELRQGDLSVAEYVDLMSVSRVTTFREAVDQALMSERDRNDLIKEAQNKRLSYQGRDQQEPGKKKTIPGQNSGKQSFKQAQPRQQIQKTQAVEGTGFRVENKVRCSKCEKIHAGQCLTGTDACFMCKKSGNFARECPLLREPTKGRVFAMTQEQVDLDTAIITGMIYVANIPAHALIDSGATHSFISEAYLTKLCIIPERMVAGYSVLLPSGEELHSNRMVKNCQMMMQNHMVGARCSDWHLLCMISTVFLLVDAFDRFFLVDALDLLRLLILALMEFEFHRMFSWRFWAGV
ncbi:hypothetical protein ZIOFF_005663 [Zingiber officinale]|uniref:Retrotransposon gag domain-containing protein n=1 Tax=Zingiber officinale TaxID=94328 RepID=A0A8J5M1R6_ZINOF|nr:hypothetical protein ZIOFF_005663 [Zingiber officinale]